MPEYLVEYEGKISYKGVMHIHERDDELKRNFYRFDADNDEHAKRIARDYIKEIRWDAPLFLDVDTKIISLDMLTKIL